MGTRATCPECYTPLMIPVSCAEPAPADEPLIPHLVTVAGTPDRPDSVTKSPLLGVVIVSVLTCSVLGTMIGHHIFTRENVAGPAARADGRNASSDANPTRKRILLQPSPYGRPTPKGTDNPALTDDFGNQDPGPADDDADENNSPGSTESHDTEIDSDVDIGSDTPWGTSRVKKLSPIYRPPSPDNSLRIEFEDFSEVTFGPLGCPVVVVGNHVWNIESREMVQQLDGKMARNGLRAISGDGKWFAAASKSPNQRETTVRAWDTATGELMCEIPGDAEVFVDLLRFTRNHNLLLGGRLSTEVRVFDVTTTEQLPSLSLPDRVRDEPIAFSPDGEHYTTLLDRRLVIYEVQERQPTTVLAAPPVDELESVSEAQRKIREMRVFSDIKIVRFSPDGQEVAAVTTEPRLLCWDANGKLVINRLFPALQTAVAFKPYLRWFPNQSGWVVSGHVIDRTTQRVVFGVDAHFANAPRFFPLDANRLLGTYSFDRNTLQVIEVPWDAIKASTALLDDQTPAFLHPAQAVSIHTHLVGVPGNRRQTVSLFRDVLKQRIATDGFEVQANSHVAYHIGFSVQEKGAIVVELVVDDQVRWRDVVEQQASIRIRESLGDPQRVRSLLAPTLKRLPYFVPESRQHFALPILVP